MSLMDFSVNEIFVLFIEIRIGFVVDSFNICKIRGLVKI